MWASAASNASALLAAWGHNNLWGTGRRVQVRGRGSWNVEDVVGNPISFDQGQINYRGDITFVNPRVCATAATAST